MDWQFLLWQYRRTWLAMGKWQEPDEADCLAFLVSEAGELVKAGAELLVQQKGYTRNNPHQEHKLAAVFEEVAGVVLMAGILADLTGKNLDVELARYFEMMDRKRRGVVDGDTVGPLGERVCL